MKAAPFEYILAKSIDEVVTLLEAGDGETVVIAGGQSLMPMLAMRMASPSMIVDINNIEGLAGIREEASEIVIMTCTRQAAVLDSALVASRVPMLTRAIAHVGYGQTRNRGTIGGSLSHADPASEIPLTALAMEAEVTFHSIHGSRRVAISDYFEGPMMTIREPNELLVSLHFPYFEGGDAIGVGFHEVSPRHGDFAIVSAAARIHLDRAGTCTKAVLALGGVDACPVRIFGLEKRLEGASIDAALIATVLEEIPEAIDPGADQHADEAYRHRVALVLAERALTDAVDDARKSKQ